VERHFSNILRRLLENAVLDLLLAELPAAPSRLVTDNLPLAADLGYQNFALKDLQDPDKPLSNIHAIVLYKPDKVPDPLILFNQALEALESDGVLLIVATFADRFTGAGNSELILLSDFLALAERFNFRQSIHQVLSSNAQTQQSEVFLKLRKGDYPKWRLAYLDTSDTERMLRLFADTFHQQMSQALRQWKYADPQALTVCVWEQDTLIGSLGGMPRKILFFGKPQTAVQIGDVMVDAHKRGILTRTGPFFRMTATFLECCAGFGKPFLLIFGFPNERHMRLAEHLHFYKQVGSLLEFSWPAVDKAPDFWTYLTPVDQNNIQSLGTNINNLWHLMAADLQQHVIGIRDWHYLLTRYLQHPENRYQIFLIKHKLTRKITGLIVVEVQETRCHLMDVISPVANIPALVRQARHLSSTLGCERLFCQISNTFADHFKIGAYRQEAVNIPIAKDTWGAGPQYKDLINAWWLMSGDMDFR